MVKFVPVQKYKEKKDDNGNNVKVAVDLYKGTDFEEVVEFLSKNGTAEQKKEFKKNCYLAHKKISTGKFVKKGKNKGKEIFEYVLDENGNPILEETNNINWLYAKKKFFEEFASEYLPKAEKKVPKHKLIEDW